MENFHGTLENHESLAQRIFPCLWYSRVKQPTKAFTKNGSGVL